MADYNSNYTGQEVDAAVGAAKDITATAAQIDAAAGFVDDLTVAATNVNTTVDALTNNAATLGDVLTADGAGGASWQPAGGGGTQLYAHNLCFQLHANSSNRASFTLTLITPDSGRYYSSTIVDKLKTYLNVAYSCFNAVVATSNPDIYGLGAIYFGGTTLQYKQWFCNLPNTPTIYNTSSTSVPNFYEDTVVAL